MISRVADHCFWFGRYLERAESTARVLAVTSSLALDTDLPPRQCWGPLIVVSGEESAFAARFGEGGAADGEAVQRYVALDEENGSSLRRSIHAARWNARAIREVVSLEAFEAINELHVWFGGEEAARLWAEQRYGFYKRVRGATQLCLGLLRSTMLHDTPLDFIWLGVMLERASQTARLMDVHHHALEGRAAPPLDAAARATGLAEAEPRVLETAVWLALLRGCSGYEPFMKRHRGAVTRRGVATFLLLEREFPRSVRYCVADAHRRLASIRPPNATQLPGGRALHRLARLHDELRVMTPDDVSSASLHAVLTHVVDETHGICGEIGRELLGYAG